MRVKTINIQLHHRDCAVFDFHFEDGTNHETEGYAPHIKGFSGGDDTDFTVDNATGQIIGWKPLTDEQMQEIIDGN